MYFVVESKSSLFSDELRARESAQITCGRAHFATLNVRESPVDYIVASSVDDVLSHA